MEEIKLRRQPALRLHQLTNVQARNAKDGQILLYDSRSGRWVTRDPIELVATPAEHDHDDRYLFKEDAGSFSPAEHEHPQYAPVDHVTDNNNPHQVTAEQTGAVANAGEVPSIQAGLEGDMPREPFVAGRLYLATDSQKLFRDDGNAWQEAIASGTPLTEAQPAALTLGAKPSVGVAEEAARADHVHPMPSITDIFLELLTVDGSGSGLDADLLDGMQPRTSADPNSIAMRDAFGDLRAYRFISTAPTGTQPFQVSSTTRVNNLNAAMLDGYTWLAPSASRLGSDVGIPERTLTAPDMTWANGPQLFLSRSGWYLVIGVFDMEVEGHTTNIVCAGALYANGTFQIPRAVLCADGGVNTRATVSQTWVVWLPSNATIRLYAARTNGVATSTLRRDNTTITAVWIAP